MRQRLQYWGPVRLATRVRQLGVRSLPELPMRTVRRLEAYAATPLKRRTFGRGSFQFQGCSHRYYVHNYTTTWRNERAVEIPLALAFLAEHGGRGLLEVGNVTRHFDKSTGHTVVDRYDVRRGVISEDIEIFRPAEPFDGLLSISTLEHVGWDDKPRDEGKIERVLGRLHELVRDPDAVLVTMPTGYNEALDEMVCEGRMPFAVEGFLARAADGTWREVGRDEALRHRYDEPFRGANAIYIGMGLRPQ